MTNPNQYKISKQQWAEFEEHYAWQLLKAPDYRLGQAFLNYFNEVDKIMHADVTVGGVGFILYYETDNKRAIQMIQKWLDQ